MFLLHFNAADVSPELMVNRDPEIKHIIGGFDAYLTEVFNPASSVDGRCMAVVGDKGIGKSILAKRVALGLRGKWSDRVVFLDVDCREWRNLREVIGDIALQCKEQLASMHTSGIKVSAGLLATCDQLIELTRGDKVSRSEIQERVLQYKAAAEIKGSFSASLVSLLGIAGSPITSLTAAPSLSGAISAERSSSSKSSTTTLIELDIQRLTRLVAALFTDIRGQGFGLFMLLDNLDELRHDYKDEAARRTVRDEAEWVLNLHKAPVAMLICMRNYFSGILPRAITNLATLPPLPPEVLVEILQRRFAKESPQIRSALAGKESDLQKIALRAPTPLALLSWASFALEYDLLAHPDCASRWRATRYASVSEGLLDQALRCFKAAQSQKKTTVSRAELLAALNNNESELIQLQHCQAILPRDFWNPTEFTLDPELAWLL